MTWRIVHLDSDTEQALSDLQAKTGQSVSEILKRGIQACQTEVQQKDSKTAYEIYKELALAPGEYAVAPASQSKEAVREIIREKFGC